MCSGLKANELFVIFGGDSLKFVPSKERTRCSRVFQLLTFWVRIPVSFNDCFLIDEVFPFELLDRDQEAGNLRLLLIRKLHDDGGSDDGGGDAL